MLIYTIRKLLDGTIKPNLENNQRNIDNKNHIKPQQKHMTNLCNMLIPRVVMPKRPMLAKPITNFDDFEPKNWIFEEKYDGERLLTVVYDNQTNIVCYTRNLKKSTIFRGSILLNPGYKNCIFDGELVYMRGDDIVSICDTGNRNALKAQYRIFDIQMMNGYDVRCKALDERKRLLDRIICETDNVRISKYHECIDIPTIMRHFDRITKSGGEGLMLKSLDQSYVCDSRIWLKVKVLHLRDHLEEYELYAHRFIKDCNGILNILDCGYYLAQCGCENVSGAIADIWMKRLSKEICTKKPHNIRYVHVTNVSSGINYNLRNKLKLMSDPTTGYFYNRVIVTLVADKLTSNKSLRHPSLYKIRNDLTDIDVGKFL